MNLSVNSQLFEVKPMTVLIPCLYSPRSCHPVPRRHEVPWTAVFWFFLQRVNSEKKERLRLKLLFVSEFQFLSLIWR